MDRIEDLVDQVIAAFDARRRVGWSATTPSLTGAGKELGRWHELVEARLNPMAARHRAHAAWRQLGAVWKAIRASKPPSARPDNQPKPDLLECVRRR